MRRAVLGLEYDWHGPPAGQGTTIVFLHEGLGSAGQWKDFPARVAEATGCSALVYSRAGYGSSSSISLPRPLDYMHREALDTLPKLLEALEVRDAVYFGHSDGSSIALISAGSPHAVHLRGAILEAPHVFAEEVSIASIMKARDAWHTTDLRARLERWHGENTEVAFRGWNDAWLDPAFRRWNLEAFLPGITVPLLLIQGRDDEYGTLAQLDAIERGTGGPSTRLVLEHCGHSPHRDQPDATLQAAVDFIKSRVS